MIQSSRNSEVSVKPDAEYLQKREANAQRTQAYHSRRESLMTSSSRDLEVSGKPDAMFSCHSESSQHTFCKETEVTATRTPLQVELKGAPKPLAMTPVVGKGSLGQSTGDGAEEM